MREAWSIYTDMYHRTVYNNKKLKMTKKKSPQENDIGGIMEVMWNQKVTANHAQRD